MNILLARIDDRFIHGQVVTRWVKQHPAERIIVVSDEVAADELRKSLLISVAPSGMKASVVSVEKMARAWHSEKYTGVDAILLFARPRDVVRLVHAGVTLSTVNVGGMIFEAGKRQITRSVSVSDDDEAAFHELNTLGITVELRQLPSDPAVNLADKL
ncbi:PTS fructose transporter subunit IIB [Izhakiella australiensis]|uniref:PTS fructose transporter subunit IIB n=1 Tax=Izhakiella australiensis TaxID=1926881 RepID=A0A1S8YQP2_9GAMM|nr:PTS system mannose/fructose/N-acetylgalactosamine-transporter subunit IIB [Izhakiella australiensis]OON41096.1 PTS fructose transporter subunit IIB [Izhakiella australiensis]